MSMTPIQYEKYCENLLKLEGWRTEPTNITGDQGADIIAISGATRAVIQCKYYSKPVGNSAVQEVIAARAYYEANVALVVAKNGFTKAAKSLAKRSLVQLVVDENLRQWAHDNREGKGHGISCMKISDIIMLLNSSGYRTSRKSAGVYMIVTPTGTKHISGDSVLMMVAEELLKNDRTRL